MSRSAVNTLWKALSVAASLFALPALASTPLPTPSTSAAQVYPNPFNPDKGEALHLGNVKAGDIMAVYNMIGVSVYRRTLTGNPATDVWDGLNSNGVAVVTGIYFVILTGNSLPYRVAVLRDSR